MTTNIQLAQQVARHVQLKSVALKSAHIDSYLPPGAAPEGEVSVELKHRCGYEESDTEHDKEIHVLADFLLRATTDDQEPHDLVKLAATFTLVYSIPKDVQPPPRCLRHFAEVNGAYNAWPYWRELVQSSAGRAGLGWLVIPVFRPVATEAPEEDCEESA